MQQIHSYMHCNEPACALHSCTSICWPKILSYFCYCNALHHTSIVCVCVQWASERGQLLWRTTKGMMMYEEALAFLDIVEGDDARRPRPRAFFESKFRHASPLPASQLLFEIACNLFDVMAERGNIHAARCQCRQQLCLCWAHQSCHQIDGLELVCVAQGVGARAGTSCRRRCTGRRRRTRAARAAGSPPLSTSSCRHAPLETFSSPSAAIAASHACIQCSRVRPSCWGRVFVSPCLGQHGLFVFCGQLSTTMSLCEQLSTTTPMWNLQQYPSFRVAYMDKVKDHGIAGNNGVTHSVLLRWSEDKGKPEEVYRVRLPWQTEDNRGVVRAVKEHSIVFVKRHTWLDRMGCVVQASRCIRSCH